MIQRLLIIPIALSLFTIALTVQRAYGADVRFVVLGHIRGGELGGLNPRLHELLEEVRALGPAFVVLTGDIIWGDLNNTPRDPENGWSASGTRLMMLFDTLGVPVYRVPGNHDISDVGTRDIWFRRYGTLPRVVSESGARVLLLSSAWIPEDSDEDNDEERRRVRAKY